MRVLVLDGQAKQALPVVRDLADAGHAVWLASPAPWLAAACWSRTCTRLRISYSDSRDVISELAAIISTYDIDVVLPLKDITTRIVAREQAQLRPATTCLAAVAAMELASHKGRVGAIAQEVGLAVPDTVICPAAGTLPPDIERVGLPAVVKAAQGSGVIRYVNSPTELRATAQAMAATHGEVVVQEYVAGEGVGFFALYDRGRCVASYTHRRLREYPDTGGISISAESTDDPPLADVGRALLDRLQWHGPAMVECKRERDTGRLVLIEVNTKFWGSLDLALVCGLLFPRWAVALATGEPVNAPESYPAGVRVYWPAPAALAQACFHTPARKALLADVRNPDMRSDWRWEDPLPHVVQVLQVPGVWWQTRGRWLAPHGRPDEVAT